MKPTRRIATTLALVALVSGAGISAYAGGQAAQDDPFEQLKSYDFQKRAPVEAIQNMVRDAQADRTKTAVIEDRIIEVLADPMTTYAGKSEACRILWMIGTAKSVPILSKMLTSAAPGDEKTANIARYALERDPDPAAGKALRAALAATTGTVQLGVINSIGDRGDAEAVNAVKPYVLSNDLLVSEAAISALGKIGTDPALGALRGLPAANLAAQRAMLRAADKMAAGTKRTAAVKIYETLAAEDRPAVIRGEALRALAVNQDPRASSIVLSALKSQDTYVQQVAAQVAGSLPDPKLNEQAVAAWPGLSAPAQVILLTVLSERRDPAVAGIAMTALDSADPDVRNAGIKAAGLVGGSRAVPRLAEIAVKGSDTEKRSARESLAKVTGPDTDKAILALALKGDGQTRSTLMGVLAERPSPATISVLMETGRGSDPRSAVEAIRALGRIGGAKEEADLVNLTASTKDDSVRDAARNTLISIGQRLSDADRNRSADTLITAIKGASGAGKAALLGVLAENGGDQSLEVITRSLTSTDPEVKQAALTALAENWNDSRPLPTLLSIAKADRSKSVRVQALRGYLRLVAQDEQMPAGIKVQHISDALAVSERPEEKRLALSALRDCRVGQAMDLSARMLDSPDTFNEAADTVIYLAAPQRKNNKDQPAVKGTVTTAALTKVIQRTKNDNQRAQAQKLRP